jgi:rfaE bifunctional protein kinase chain/domain
MAGTKRCSTGLKGEEAMNSARKPPAGVETFNGLSTDRAHQLLHSISQLKVGVIGDGCLDVYWHADMSISELSRETPHYPLPVVQERFSPGAAGNVAANVKALGVREVRFCSVIGEDWRGGLLEGCLRELGIDDSPMLRQNGWVTPAYCKPIRYGYQGSRQEDPRIDFGNKTPLPAEAVAKLLGQLDELAVGVDAIAVTDQLPCGVITPEIRERLAYWAGQGKVVVVDSRDRISRYSGIIMKPNEIEAMRSFPDLQLNRHGESGWEAWLEAGKQLSAKNQAPCCMTLGENGSVWLEADTLPVWVPARTVKPPLDIVGAGDCFSSALLCALAAGGTGPEAMSFAHLAASVVFGKIGITGTASPYELLERLAP